MVGVAMRVGEGKMTLEEVKKSLDATERKIISFKADPSGLCLEDVIY
jgi:tRNA U38,U39,U40 pseudouridine synthase TruA